MQPVPSVIVPIITPFKKNGGVYEKGIENLICFLKNKGIQGVWILGSYGAFPLLSTEERRYMAEITLCITKRFGMYSIVHIGAPDIDKAIDLADHAAQYGADAIATVLPYYYSSSTYREANFLEYFKAIISSASLPVFYYNNPKTTGYAPSAEFIKKLLKLGVSGMKDTTTNFLSISENISIFGEYRPEGVYMGGSASVFLPARIMGAPAVVCGTAVSMPELVLKLDKAIKLQQWEDSKNLQHLLIKARSIQARYVGRSMACYGIFSGRGIDVGKCRLPWIGMNEKQITEVVTELVAIGAIPHE